MSAPIGPRNAPFFDAEIVLRAASERALRAKGQVWIAICDFQTNSSPENERKIKASLELFLCYRKMVGIAHELLQMQPAVQRLVPPAVDAAVRALSRLSISSQSEVSAITVESASGDSKALESADVSCTPINSDS